MIEFGGELPQAWNVSKTFSTMRSQQMITSDNKRLIETSLRNLAETHSAAVNQLEQTIAVLAGVLEIDDIFVAVTSARQAGHSSRRMKAPIADRATMSVVYQGRKCALGNTLMFWFFDRLARSPNRYVSHVDLLDAVWDGQRARRVSLSGCRM